MAKMMKVVMVAGLCLSGTAQASPAGSRGSELAGTWILTAADTLYPDGHRVHGFGDHPEGRMMVDRQGRYTIEIYRAAAVNFASGTKAGGSSEEFRDAMLRNSVHYGHVSLDHASHHIIFDVELSVFPNWEGKRQTRDYTLKGDHLVYQVPASATGDGTIAISEWQKLADGR